MPRDLRRVISSSILVPPPVIRLQTIITISLITATVASNFKESSCFNYAILLVPRKMTATMTQRLIINLEQIVLT